MKKRNLILLPLLVLGSTGLSSLVTSCSKLPESVEFATDEAVVVRVGQPVELPGVTVLPEKAEDKTYSFALSSEGIVKLEEDEGKYYLTGVAPGEVVITVTSTANPELKDTILVKVPTPDPLPTPIVKTVAEVSAMTATDSQHLYEVTGVVSQISHDKYGNMYLSSSDGSASIQVYGVAPDASCFDWTDYNYTNIKFTNPQNFITSGLSDDIDLGDVITLVCQFKMYNTTPEIMGYVKAGSIVKSSTRPNYSITLSNDDTKGTAAFVEKNAEDAYVPVEGLDLTKLCWGQKLTLQATPISSEDVAVVKANGTKVEANDDGTYTIVVVPGLEVEVSYKLATLGLYEMTGASFGLKNNYTNYTGKCSGMELAALGTADYGDGIQMRAKNGVQSAVYNTTETTGNIVSIKVTFSSTKYTAGTAMTKELVNVVASTTAFNVPADAKTIGLPETGVSSQVVKFDGTNFTVEFTFEASAGYKYFALNHTTVSGTEYFASIVVTTDAYTPAA
ncbi:MAG: hypothetical protein SPK28_05260 [Bacilli bacterium]|nr:hypothetical protein [Bacilli bacterium]